jgi:hypothetical protein
LAWGLPVTGDGKKMDLTDRNSILEIFRPQGQVALNWTSSCPSPDSRNGSPNVRKNRINAPNDTKKWTKPIRNWKEALNHFAIMFEGRMPKDLA